MEKKEKLLLLYLWSEVGLLCTEQIFVIQPFAKSKAELLSSDYTREIIDMEFPCKNSQQQLM